MLENEAENSFQYSNEECSPHPAEKRARSRAFVTPQCHNDERIHELEKGIQRYEEEIQFLK